MLPLFNQRKKMNAFFAIHPMINAVAHFAAGFGVAILVQHYLKYNLFASVWVGIGLVAVSILIHLYPCMKK